MTAITKALQPKHRVSVRNVPTNIGTTADPTIVLAPGDTVFITGGAVTPPPPPPPVDPPPPPPPPPSVTIPPKPAEYTWAKDFADDTLAPFHGSTIPSDPNHVANDPMAKYNRYGDNSTNPPTLLHVADFSGPFVRQVATRRADGLYAGTILSTADDPRSGAASRIVKKGWKGQIRFAFRMNVGDRTWQTGLWLVGWTGWSWNSCEIDICEVIAGKLTFNLHAGPWGNRQVASIAPPADLATVFHTAGINLTGTALEFVFDEKVVGTAQGMPDHDLAYLSDAKVGIPWENKGPTAATPDTTFVDLGWITEKAA